MILRRLVAFLAASVFAVASAEAATDAGSATAPVDSAQVQGLQERLLNDPGIMALIMDLQNDPEMQALLSDPKVLEAIQGGDIEAVMKDPRFLKLLDNPSVKEIGERLEKQGSGEKP